jgi:hypothetical protein
MNMLSADMKNRSSHAALGSVRAEGYNPSAKVLKQAERYVSGSITKRQLRSSALKDAKAKNRNK